MWWWEAWRLGGVLCKCRMFCYYLPVHNRKNWPGGLSKIMLPSFSILFFYIYTLLCSRTRWYENDQLNGVCVSSFLNFPPSHLSTSSRPSDPRRCPPQNPPDGQQRGHFFSLSSSWISWGDGCFIHSYSLIIHYYIQGRFYSSSPFFLFHMCEIIGR